MVGPVLGVIIEFRDIVDFVFGFHISVLSCTYINTDTAFVVIFEVNPAVANGLTRCIDRYATCSCAHS